MNAAYLTEYLTSYQVVCITQDCTSFGLFLEFLDNDAFKIISE